MKLSISGSPSGETFSARKHWDPYYTITKCEEVLRSKRIVTKRCRQWCIQALCQLVPEKTVEMDIKQLTEQLVAAGKLSDEVFLTLLLILCAAASNASKLHHGHGTSKCLSWFISIGPGNSDWNYATYLREELVLKYLGYVWYFHQFQQKKSLTMI